MKIRQRKPSKLLVLLTGSILLHLFARSLIGEDMSQRRSGSWIVDAGTDWNMFIEVPGGQLFEAETAEETNHLSLARLVCIVDGGKKRPIQSAPGSPTDPPQSS